METIKKESTDVVETAPQVLNAKNVCYWFEKEGKLLGDQSSKARKFIQHKCIVKTDEGYICKPLKGYNVTTYKMRDDQCTCQWNKKYNKQCSHLLAVELFEFMEGWNK